MITRDENMSKISSNTVKSIIIQVICLVNDLKMLKALLTSKGYIRFKTLVCKVVFC